MNAPPSIAQLLDLEERAYVAWNQSSVKQETEESYFEAFKQMPEIPVTPGIPAKGKRVAFIVRAASLLAHVQLMRGVLREQDRVFVLKGDHQAFRNLLPCPVISLPQVSMPERFEMLRERMSEHECGTMIWVSIPLHARYAFGLRLAEKQVFWSMRYHPIAPGDLNITAGKRGEKTRLFNGSTWNCIHSPFNIELNPINKLSAESYRVPYEYVYGTLAREQKLSPEYLEAVAHILSQHPQSGFVWTGRKEPPHIRQFFRERGLSNRQRFVGWQDPDLFVNTVDCFLETFPLGGLTTFTAMGHGIPTVTLKQEHSPSGSLENAPVGLLQATGRDDYVKMALSLQDRAVRAKAVEAGHKLLGQEIKLIEQDKRDFWKIINHN